MPVLSRGAASGAARERRPIAGPPPRPRDARPGDPRSRCVRLGPGSRPEPRSVPSNSPPPALLPSRPPSLPALTGGEPCERRSSLGWGQCVHPHPPTHTHTLRPGVSPELRSQLSLGRGTVMRQAQTVALPWLGEQRHLLKAPGDTCEWAAGGWEKTREPKSLGQTDWQMREGRGNESCRLEFRVVALFFLPC